ncbi:helix-turn-helix domain-containing protein [Algoriphagus sp. H41]|uniref:Helix-turn-helix domain-containing protein n=1 Tax=Algoriphagus oliviformis TaxID=2811231 RepID=A0ABS3C2E7_9BACT|nr:helix-turn-helix domain-containing protein [Algoriphagus oliviformis]MBN7810776.1 helix-turn-helix domain-containing protein [Algoriphagus oliviformis]
MGDDVMEERIVHAKRKLVATNRLVTEIVFDCGFNSVSRFNAAFMKINGCTPRDFRNKYKLGRGIGILG